MLVAVAITETVLVGSIGHIGEGAVWGERPPLRRAAASRDEWRRRCWLAVAIAETVPEAAIGHVGKGPVGRDGYAKWVPLRLGTVATTVLVARSITETVLEARVGHVGKLGRRTRAPRPV